MVTIAGEIVDGEGGPGSAAGDTVAKLIYDALDQKDLKALVVRVDSPGGSVLASEKIRLAIAAAKAKKIPVVVSMANLAASGGYWVSLPADVIFAEPSTITGSIGIFGVIPSAEAGLAKIGVNADGVKTTPLSGEPDVLGGFSPEFDRVAQSAIENGYRDFITRVATARKKTPEQVDAIAQGRVWAGGTARQIGLVDRLWRDGRGAGRGRKTRWLEGRWLACGLYRAAAKLCRDVARRVDAKARIGSSHRWIFSPMPRGSSNCSWQRVAADLDMLTGVKGVQARCLECARFWVARDHCESRWRLAWRRCARLS